MEAGDERRKFPLADRPGWWWNRGLSRPDRPAEDAAAVLKLLLVEDNEINLDMICRRLRKKFDLAVARSGTEALEKARTEAPAVILMDLGLPDIDGLEATRR